MSFGRLMDDLEGQENGLMDDFEPHTFGCTDLDAVNYDAQATANDGSCWVRGTVSASVSLVEPDSSTPSDASEGVESPTTLVTSAESVEAMPATAEKDTLYLYSENQRMHPDDALTMYRMGHILGQLMDKHELVWFATDGTLLGLVRNKGIIPHDDDIDLAVLDEQLDEIKSRKFQDDLHENGLHLVAPPGRTDRIYIWNWTSFVESSGRGTPNARGTRMKIDLWPMTKGAGTLHQLHATHYGYPSSICVNSTEFKKMAKDDAKRMMTGMHTSKWHCALRRYPFGEDNIWAPSMVVSDRYLFRHYGNYKQPLCKETLHTCHLVSNTTHDITAHAMPTGPLTQLKSHSSGHVFILPWAGR
jgi:hypothetical protein